MGGAGPKYTEAFDSYDTEDAAIRGLQPSESAYGSRSAGAEGKAQGLAMRIGKGRIVVLGEAALLSAQIIRYTDREPRDIKIGMNTAGNDDPPIRAERFSLAVGIVELIAPFDHTT